MKIFTALLAAVVGVRNLLRLRSRQEKMRKELEVMAGKRHEETIAFARTMIASIEANELESGAIELLAEMLNRPGRQVSGQKDVMETLRRLLSEPDYLRHHFNSLESEWKYERQVRELVSVPTMHKGVG